MTYTLNITGHLTDDPELAKTKEEAFVENARDFVESLDEVAMAQFVGQYVGTVNLLEKVPEE